VSWAEIAKEVGGGRGEDEGVSCPFVAACIRLSTGE
jgi:hypothetical protein